MDNKFFTLAEFYRLHDAIGKDHPRLPKMVNCRECRKSFKWGANTIATTKDEILYCYCDACGSKHRTPLHKFKDQML